jgi:NAD(P)-dependent dehydrogenase (short-subunit alcohol dehydrogenase family)
LSEAAGVLGHHGSGRVVGLAGDVTDAEHLSGLVKEASELGGFSLLINNASTLGPSPQPKLRDYSSAALQRVLAVNLVAPLRLTQLCLPLLRQSAGSIVNITSDAAVEAYEGWGGYGLSKAALEQMSRVLAVEEPDLKVYWFDPGDMRTRMHQEAFPGEDISDRPLPEDRVPGLMALLDGDFPSGRYTAEALLTLKGAE